MLDGKLHLGNALHCVPSEMIYCRANHVLAEIYNKSMRTLLFIFLLTSGVGQIISTVTLILQTNSDSVPFLANVFFASVVPQAVLINLVAFGFGGQFHKSSNLSLKQLKQSVRTVKSIKIRDRKYLERFLNSCQASKIKFGLSNFIEKRTPPMFQQFCVQRIVDLLLLR